MPVGALLNRGQGCVVWVFDPATSTISERPVKVDRITESAAIVSAGVSAGEQVVAGGAHRLANGERIVAVAN